MKCASCKKLRNTIKARKSELVDIDLFLCDECANKGFEPRYLVVIAGRSKGFEVVKDYIVNHRYNGPDILAAEIIANKE